jgi:hypothetical protein
MKHTPPNSELNLASLASLGGLGLQLNSVLGEQPQEGKMAR